MSTRSNRFKPTLKDARLEVHKPPREIAESKTSSRAKCKEENRCDFKTL